MRAFLLYYDIPKVRRAGRRSGPRLTDAYPNPSGFLRSRAVRVNLSCWVVPDGMIPHTLLHDMQAASCRVNYVRFADDEAQNLIRLAADLLREEAARAVESARESVRRAAERQEGEDELSPEKAEARCRKAVSGAARKMQILLGDLERAAAAFGIRQDTLPLEEAAMSIRVIQSAALRRAEAYAKAARRARLVGAGDGLGEAAVADTVPPGVLADYLEDRGEDVSELREAFAGEGGD